MFRSRYFSSKAGYESECFAYLPRRGYVLSDRRSGDATLFHVALATRLASRFVVRIGARTQSCAFLGNSGFSVIVPGEGVCLGQ